MFADEDEAREFLESQLWPEGPGCPHCGEHGAYKLTAHKLVSKRPMRKGVHKCKGCRKQFTVRVGTIFEESKLPLPLSLGDAVRGLLKVDPKQLKKRVARKEVAKKVQKKKGGP